MSRILTNGMFTDEPGGQVTMVEMALKLMPNLAEHPELIEEACRNNRNTALMMCDWTVAADSQMNVPAWIEYRQALRDLTKDPDWPNTPFPEPPETV